jgi:TRAP-type C4-dicarboxylate transport system substrate-binding protein
MRQSAQLLAAATALAMAALVVAGCSESRIDKAGGSRPGRPLVLTLAAHSGDEPYAEPFATAVERRSGGTVRIEIVGNWRSTGTKSEIDYERGIVSDVRSGKAPLGIVGARVWDTLGLPSFQALVAPFLIDSLRLERRALASPLAAQALASVRQKGVIGIALLPGLLRRPFGITRPLIRLQDYRSKTIGIRESLAAEETLHSLGAHTRAYIPGDLSGLDGAELDPLTITEDDFDQRARGLTANVVLWPKPWTIIINAAVFGRLTHSQRQILLAAGREAVSGELLQTAHDQQVGLSNLCSERFPLVTATTADLAALRTAVQPVYQRMERNPLTKRWITQIRRMRTSAAPEIAHCRRP